MIFTLHDITIPWIQAGVTQDNNNLQMHYKAGGMLAIHTSLSYVNEGLPFVMVSPFIRLSCNYK